MPHWCRQRQQAAAGDAHVRREREGVREKRKMGCFACVAPAL
jgi:hypothetical protein